MICIYSCIYFIHCSKSNIFKLSSLISSINNNNPLYRFKITDNLFNFPLKYRTRKILKSESACILATSTPNLLLKNRFNSDKNGSGSYKNGSDSEKNECDFNSTNAALAIMYQKILFNALKTRCIISRFPHYNMILLLNC